MEVRRRVALLLETGPLRSPSPVRQGVQLRPEGGTGAEGCADGLASALPRQTEQDPIPLRVRAQVRRDAATKLWKQWAAQTLGQLGHEPSPEEQHAKVSKIWHLEQQCVELAARAQRRLDLSSVVRRSPYTAHRPHSARPQSGLPSQQQATLPVATHHFDQSTSPTARSCTGSDRLIYNGGYDERGAVAGGVVTGTRGRPPGSGPRPSSAVSVREAQWAARERAREATYACVREAGAAEAATLASGGRPDGQPPTLHSRPMLQALLSQAASSSAGACYTASSFKGIALNVSASSSSKPRPQSAAGGHSGGSWGHDAISSSTWSGNGTAACTANSGMARTASGATGDSIAAGMSGRTSRARPASAAAGGGARMSSNGSCTSSSRPGWPKDKASDGALAAADEKVQRLQQEVDGLLHQLDLTAEELQSKADVEMQLREAVDLLRGRVHGQSVREVAAQRQLLQAAHLTPLFEALGENFTFRTPEEVVARLEYLEDDKMGTMQQLIRAEEDVSSLQAQLAASRHAVDTTRTAMGVEALQGSAHLQSEVQRLGGEVAAQEELVRKLSARQAQLVALQTGVLELWNACSADPAFAAANKPAAGMPALDPADPVAVLASVQEYLMSRSAQSSSRHYQEVQQVANRVWNNHFPHQEALRGRVVPTFERLSNLADTLSQRVKTVEKQLVHSQGNARGMQDMLKKLQRQRRALTTELERRDDLLRTASGVPRNERPVSVSARYSSTTPTAASTLCTTAHKQTTPLQASWPRQSKTSRPQSAPVRKSSAGPLSHTGPHQQEHRKLLQQQHQRLHQQGQRHCNAVGPSLVLSDAPEGSHWAGYQTGVVGTATATHSNTTAGVRCPGGSLTAKCKTAGQQPGLEKLCSSTGLGQSSGSTIAAAAPHYLAVTATSPAEPAWIPPNRAAVEAAFMLQARA